MFHTSKIAGGFFSHERNSAFFTSKKDWSKGDVGGPSPISTGAAQSLYSAPQFVTAATQLAVLSSHAPDPFAKATFIFNHPIFMTSWCIKKTMIIMVSTSIYHNIYIYLYRWCIYKLEMMFQLQFHDIVRPLPSISQRSTQLEIRRHGRRRKL